MTAEVLRRVLAEAAREVDDGFSIGGEATLIVDAGGSLLMIEKLKRAEVKNDGYVVATTARGERFLFGVDSVCGLKLGRDSEDDGAGFVGPRRG